MNSEFFGEENLSRKRREAASDREVEERGGVCVCVGAQVWGGTAKWALSLPLSFSRGATTNVLAKCSNFSRPVFPTAFAARPTTRAAVLR